MDSKGSHQRDSSTKAKLISARRPAGGAAMDCAGEFGGGFRGGMVVEGNSPGLDDINGHLVLIIGYLRVHIRTVQLGN